MFIRREALDKSGLLDEDFFMYGEDIDLSYRLLQTGYNNYYFPGTAIIHFKGKSTPRNSFKDIHHFYKAMRIYVRKRAKEGNYGPFILLIICAICLREGSGSFKSFIKTDLTQVVRLAAIIVSTCCRYLKHFVHLVVLYAENYFE